VSGFQFLSEIVDRTSYQKPEVPVNYGARGNPRVLQQRVFLEKAKIREKVVIIIIDAQRSFS